MTYTYRMLDSFGETFFRILQRRDISDSWQVTPSTFDYSNEEDARRKVLELSAGRKSHEQAIK